MSQYTKNSPLALPWTTPTEEINILPTDAQEARWRSTGGAQNEVSVSREAGQSDLFDLDLSFHSGLPETNQNSFSGNERRRFDDVLSTFANDAAMMNWAGRNLGDTSLNFSTAQGALITSVSDEEWDWANLQPVDKLPQGPVVAFAKPSDGYIKINCTTIPSSASQPQETLLADADKLNPGWFSNVNWSDDDNDGWNPTSTLTTTADPNAIYTPDRDDTDVVVGDRDLRKFVVYVAAEDMTGNHNWSFKLTFPSSVGVYLQNTKANPVTSGQVFADSELEVESIVQKKKVFWLEGRSASSAFKDVDLKAEYVGNNINMPSLTDTVKVTVFGVTQQAICAGDGGLPGEQQKDDKFRFSAATVNGLPRKLSQDEVGKISWDLPSYIGWETTPPPGKPAGEYCQYFTNCMEMQGTVSPPRDTRDSTYYGSAEDPSNPGAPPPAPITPSIVFSQKREANGYSYMKKGNAAWVSNLPGHLTVGEWKPDNDESAQSNKPTMTSHIYYDDAPCYIKKDTTELDYMQYCLNFKNAVYVKIYGLDFMCSDYGRWYSQMYLKPNPNNRSVLTRAVPNYQILKSGWETLPTPKPDDLELTTW